MQPQQEHLNGKGEVSPMMLDPKIDTASTRERGLGCSPAIFARLRPLFVCPLMQQTWCSSPVKIEDTKTRCWLSRVESARSGSVQMLRCKDKSAANKLANKEPHPLQCNIYPHHRNMIDRTKESIRTLQVAATGVRDWRGWGHLVFWLRLNSERDLKSSLLVCWSVSNYWPERQQEESAAESSPNAQKSKPARANSAAQNMRPEQHSGTTSNHNRRDSLLRGESEWVRERKREPPSYPP